MFKKIKSKISNMQKLLIFSVFFLAGNGILIYIVYESSKELEESQQQTEQSEHVIELSDQLVSLGWL